MAYGGLTLEQAEEIKAAVNRVKKQSFNSDTTVHGWRITYTLRVGGHSDRNRGDFCLHDPRNGKKIHSIIAFERNIGLREPEPEPVPVEACLDDDSDDGDPPGAKRARWTLTGDRPRRASAGTVNYAEAANGAWGIGGGRAAADQARMPPRERERERGRGRGETAQPSVCGRRWNVPGTVDGCRCWLRSGARRRRRPARLPATASRAPPPPAASRSTWLGSAPRLSESGPPRTGRRGTRLRRRRCRSRRCGAR